MSNLVHWGTSKYDVLPDSNGWATYHVDAMCTHHARVRSTNLRTPPHNTGTSLGTATPCTEYLVCIYIYIYIHIYICMCTSPKWLKWLAVIYIYIYIYTYIYISIYIYIDIYICNVVTRLSRSIKGMGQEIK